MVIKYMRNEKTTFSTLLIGFLISYFYYTNIIQGQLNLFTIGKESIWFSILIYFISPFIMLLMAKKGEKLRMMGLTNFTKSNNLDKSFLINKICITLYFILTNVFVILYTIYFDYVYLNIEYDYIIVGLIIILPIIIFAKNSIKSSFSSQIFPAVLLIIYFLILVLHPQELNLYAIEYIPIQNNETIQKLIIFLIPVIFEPFLFFYIFDFSKHKIKKKSMIIPIFFIAFFASYNIARAGNDFGILLNKIQFPFFQSIEIMYLNEYMENTYNLGIIVWFICAIFRLFFTTGIIQHIWNIKNKSIPIIMTLISFFVSIILTHNSILYEEIKLTLIVIIDSLLVITSFITIFYLTKLKDVKKNEKTNSKFN